MIDKSGMFEDFNFKLVVINDILDKKSSFGDKLKELEDEYVDSYEWYTDAGCIAEVTEFFEELTLTDEDLDKVTELCFDGGNDVYFLLLPDWNGEDDIFDVKKSVAGFEKLKNLEKVIYVSMCEPEILKPIENSGVEVL